MSDLGRQLWATTECWWCNKPVAVKDTQPDDWPYWTHWTTYYKRGRGIMQFYPVCAVCFEMDKAIATAQLEGVRFTEISVWERHHCGRTLHAMSGSCIHCSRELRLLDFKFAEIKIARRMVNQLLRSARERQAA